MGAVEEAVPPVELLPYQDIVLPELAVADNVDMEDPTQLLTLLTVGAAGKSLTTIVNFNLVSLSQPEILEAA